MKMNGMMNTSRTSTSNTGTSGEKRIGLKKQRKELQRKELQHKESQRRPREQRCRCSEMIFSDDLRGEMMASKEEGDGRHYLGCPMAQVLYSTGKGKKADEEADKCLTICGACHRTSSNVRSIRRSLSRRHLKCRYCGASTNCHQMRIIPLGGGDSFKELLEPIYESLEGDARNAEGMQVVNFINNIKY